MDTNERNCTESLHPVAEYSTTNELSCESSGTKSYLLLENGGTHKIF